MCPFQMAPCPFENLGRTLRHIKHLLPTSRLTRLHINGATKAFDHIIDYIITRREEIRNIMDTRVIPSDNVSTDHGMVVAIIRKETRRNRIGRTFQRRSFNVKKLMQPDINRKYQEEISYKLAQLPNQQVGFC